MDVEKLELRLEFWKQGLLFAAGATVTFLVTSLVAKPKYGFTVFGWFLELVIFWLALASPGFYLLLSKKWRRIPISDRLNTVFGYLGCAWMVLITYRITEPLNGDSFCLSMILLAALILGAAYFYLRKKKDAPEERFP